MVKYQRPINLNLLTIRQPVTAVLSILHRISGILLFLSLPLLLWMLSLALSTPAGYEAAAQYLSHPLGRLVALILWAAVALHWVAGLRHIVMDMGWGESLRSARLSAMAALLLTALLVILGGVWLW